MLSDTLKKFGYPELAVKEYSHWAVLLRQKQVTLGSLIVICKEEATEFSSISPAAWAQLPQVVGDVEKTTKALFSYDKINYLMLMMVDPQVHFHVLPRYQSTQVFTGITFHDQAWPGAPDLSSVNEVSSDNMVLLLEHVRQAFR